MLTANWLADIKAQKDATAKQEEQRQALLATQIQRTATQWDPVVRRLLRELGEATWGHNIPLLRKVFEIEFWDRTRDPTATVLWYGPYLFNRKGQAVKREGHWEASRDQKLADGVAAYSVGWRLWHRVDSTLGLEHQFHDVWMTFTAGDAPKGFLVEGLEATESSLRELLREAYRKGPSKELMVLG